MEWLSSGGFTEPRRREGAEVDVLVEELLDELAEAVGLQKDLGIWLRNSKFLRMSCTFGEKPSR
jgi:hypothetical protein